MNFRAYGSLAAAYSGTGDLAQAESSLRKAVELNPGGAVVHYWLSGALRMQGKSADALAAIETRYASIAAYQIAKAYAVRHDSDKTFAWLDRAFRQHDGGLLSVRYNLRPEVGADQRFKNLLRKMNLAE